MGKGFKKGADGTNPLNFKVVGGTTRPSSPNANAIWINTGTKITDRVFQATQPSGVSGRVWISIGTSSAAAFNALKKNILCVYPLSAKQYIDGAWVEKEAEIYKNGAWVKFITYLYNRGDECTAYSGGWNAYAYMRSSPSGTGSEVATAPTLTKGASYMEVKFKEYSPGSASSGAYNYPGSVFAEKAIDLTGVSKISITLNGYSRSGSSSKHYLEVVTGKANNYNSVAKIQLTKAGTFTLDVSSLSGTHYVVIGVDDSLDNSTIQISEVSYQ